MGVTDQKMNTSLFDDDLKKPDRALTISKKNLFFIIFAVIILQAADTVILWLMGARKDSNSPSGDSFVFSAVIFAILKCAYERYYAKSGKKVCNEEKAPKEEEDCCQSATYVVDTMKVKGPPSPKKTSIQKAVTSIKKRMEGKPEQVGCEATIWVSSWWRPQCLNPYAKKFTPLRTYQKGSPLNSNSALFMPQKFAMKEEELLKSESGGSDAGEVVYRSNHWLTEIGFQNKTKDPLPFEDKKTQKFETKNSQKRSKSTERVKSQKAEPRKWVPKSSAIKS